MAQEPQSLAEACSSITPLWVTNDAELRQHAARWMTAAYLAVDSEFMRITTYYPKPALVQLFDGEQVYLVDPQSIQDFSPLAAVMTNPAVCKLMHACSEDLEVLQALLGQLPVNLVDTQIAAAMVGEGFSVGYARLVEACLGVHLPKDETRSDWLQRPLTAAQQRYAVWDVFYLLPLAQQLLSRLDALGRRAWLVEDCSKLLEHYQAQQDPAQSYLRLKGTGKMSRRELAILQLLCEWREGEAQLRNMPRNHLIKEASLYAIAELKPKHISQLRALEAMSDRAIKHYGETLIDLVAAALALPEHQLPAAPERPLSGAQQQKVKQLRAWVETQAQQWQMAPEILARKRDYESLVRGLEGQPPGVLQGWRREWVGNQLVVLCQ
jgi:ribonuclease D